jgi:hypothetical protein
VNLLDHFVLQHVQISLLQAELVRVGPEAGTQEAKVELNLTPRLMETKDGDRHPTYQVSARLSCRGGEEEGEGPRFSARVGFEAIYQQLAGEPIDLSVFTDNHASLTRQLYPLLQHEMRLLLIRLGLERVHLPFDLAASVESGESQTIEVSGAVH